MEIKYEKNFESYQYLMLLAMIYIAVDITSMAFAYKIIVIKNVVLAACSLIFPLTYSIMDVIAEIYGYQLAKKVIWYGFICDFIFATLALFLSHLPSHDPSQTGVYVQVFGLLLRAVIAQMAGVLIGAFVNIHFLLKWKILTRGRYFWLRSIGASTIGEAIMLIISVLIALIGVISLRQLIILIEL